MITQSQYNETNRLVEPLRIQKIVASETHAVGIFESVGKYDRDILVWGQNVNGCLFRADGSSI